jgi:hypothetical protein
LWLVGRLGWRGWRRGRGRYWRVHGGVVHVARFVGALRFQ